MGGRVVQASGSAAGGALNKNKTHPFCFLRLLRNGHTHPDPPDVLYSGFYQEGEACYVTAGTFRPSRQCQEKSGRPQAHSPPVYTCYEELKPGQFVFHS